MHDEGVPERSSGRSIATLRPVNGPHFIPSRRVAVGVVAAVLVLFAVSLVPALRDERRLASANDALRLEPAVALRESVQASGPGTRARATATSVNALVALGDLSAAERLARTDARSHPADPIVVRRLYLVQRLRSRAVAARRTLRVLRRLDPKFADGSGF